MQLLVFVLEFGLKPGKGSDSAFCLILCFVKPFPPSMRAADCRTGGPGMCAPSACLAAAGRSQQLAAKVDNTNVELCDGRAGLGPTAGKASRNGWLSSAAVTAATAERGGGTQRRAQLHHMCSPAALQHNDSYAHLPIAAIGLLGSADTSSLAKQFTCSIAFYILY